MSDAYNAIITEVEPAPARPGPLHGRRLLVKDLIDTEGIRTTYGSKIYADHVPTRTATAVERLVAAGAVVVGKANLHDSRGGSRARTTGTAPSRTRACPAYDRWLVRGQCGRARRGLVRPRSRDRHRLLDPSPRVVLRRRRAEAVLGAGPDRRRLPALPELRHCRADGNDSARGDHVVRARRRADPSTAARRARR